MVSKVRAGERLHGIYSVKY